MIKNFAGEQNVIKPIQYQPYFDMAASLINSLYTQGFQPPNIAVFILALIVTFERNTATAPIEEVSAMIAKDIVSLYHASELDARELQ